MVDRTQLWASGGGVQSAAIAALIVRGDLPKPDLAIIVDTGREKPSTWRYMDAVIAPNLARVGVTLHRVPTRDFEKRGLYGGKDGETFLMPAFTTQAGTGDLGKLSNFCSSYWKREVIKRWANRVHGVKAVDQWLGISTDEMERMQRRNGKWRTRYPLIEQRMNRGDCVALVSRMGWPPAPRSSCSECPNQTQQEWRETRDHEPVEWQRVVRFDHAIRKRDPHLFLHSDGVPLDQANLDDANGALFGHGCTSGHCFT